MSAEPHPAVAALRRSHERLATLVLPLDAAELRGPSYASEWTIAQVLSHLGSGAEIGGLGLAGAIAGEPAPAHSAFTAIWDTWNAKTPDEQAADVIPADLALVEAYEQLDDAQLRDLRLPLGPMELDAATMVRMRLGEHAAHVWDIAVALDPTATVDTVAVEQIIDGLGMLAGFIGKPSGSPVHVRISTTDPEREIVLDVDEKVTLSAWDGVQDLPRLTLPAEAFFRLVFGRLDPDHTPAIEGDDVDLDDLRKIFPGF